MSILTTRERYEMTAPWRKTADDLLERSPFPSAPDLGLDPTMAPPSLRGGSAPPTTTNIPREQFDNILAGKGVTYDQHLDNLESHYNAATEGQKKRGRVWYRAAGDTLRDIGRKAGFSTNRAIAMGAALSGRTDWNNNLHFVAHMANNYQPGQNEDEWKRANIHPSAMARYMENKYDITPGPKEEGDLSHPDHFSIRELKDLHKGGYMPRTKADFNQLADAHGGDHLQYTPPGRGLPGSWENKPLRGFEELQTPEGRAAWLNNAQMSSRGGTEGAPNKWNPVKRQKGEPPPDPGVRKPWEDAIDSHMRSVKDTTSPYGFQPGSAYTGAGVPTLGGNIEKAKLLRQVPEEDFDKHLNGPKYKAFFSNLGNNLKFLKADRPEDQGYYDHGGKHWSEHDPEYQRSTIDTQHMRAASTPHGNADAAPNYRDAAIVTPEQYEVYQQGMADLTHRINSKQPSHRHLMPHQVQAIIWGKFKDDLDAREGKKGVGQTYWSPTMHDIPGFGDRYSRRLALILAMGVEPEWHIHPELLAHPHSDPYLTDSSEWWNNVLDSWHHNHQHELSTGLGGDVPASQDPHLAGVLHLADAVLTAAGHDPFEFAEAEGPHETPWTGGQAELLREHCPYCHADPGEPCDPRCPTNHSESPRDWAMDTKAVGTPFQLGPQFDPMQRLNSVDDVLAYSAAVVKNSTGFEPFGQEWQDSIMKDRAETGGYSRRPDGSTPPPRSFMVSEPHDEFKQPMDDFSAESAADYGRGHKERFEKDPDLYQGGWGPEKDPEFYHDLSKAHDDLWNAADAAYDHNQHAFYDTHTGEEPSPLEFRGPDGTHGLWMAKTASREEVPDCLLWT